jgi:hypothetical protein
MGWSDVWQTKSANFRSRPVASFVRCSTAAPVTEIVDFHDRALARGKLERTCFAQTLRGFA